MLSSLTDAQLQTMLTALLASHTRTLNSQAYGVGSRNIQRAQLADLMAQIKAVSDELSARGLSQRLTPDEVIVQFGEPQ